MSSASVPSSVASSVAIPVTGAAAGFLPPDLTGNVLWLDAADASTITDTAGAVSQWDDKSTVGTNDVTQGTGSLQPETDSRTINSLNVLDFDGGDSLSVVLATTITQPATVFIVMRQDATGVDDYIYSGQSALDFGLFSQVDDSMQFAAGSTPIGTATGTADTSPHVHTFKVNTTASEGRIDGTVVASGNIGTPNSASGFRLGARFNDTRGLNGAIAEFIVYDRLLIAGEITQVEDYLTAKWDL